LRHDLEIAESVKDLPEELYSEQKKKLEVLQMLFQKYADEREVFSD
jgi:hypothetical protein